jgi:hypothetical protein
MTVTGEKGVTVTVDMVRQEMCRSAVTYMLSKVSVNLLAVGMQRFHGIIQRRHDQVGTYTKFLI